MRLEFIQPLEGKLLDISLGYYFWDLAPKLQLTKAMPCPPFLKQELY